MKNTIIFDFFGVVSSEVAPGWIAANLPNESEGEVRDKYIRKADAGKLSPDELYNILGKKSGMTAQEVERGWHAHVKINNNVQAYMRELKQTKTLALCSNAWTDFIRPILDDNNLNELFEVITISSEIGHVKPDKEIYLATVGELGVEPEDCIFVDDNNENVIAAEALGMEGHVFTSLTTLQTVLG